MPCTTYYGGAGLQMVSGAPPWGLGWRGTKMSFHTKE